MKDNLYMIIGIGMYCLLLACASVANADSNYSAGYRYYYDADEAHKGKMRLFGKRETLSGITKLGWDRYVGNSPNFFRTGTVNGHSLDKTGTFFIEQEFKF